MSRGLLLLIVISGLIISGLFVFATPARAASCANEAQDHCEFLSPFGGAASECDTAPTVETCVENGETWSCKFECFSVGFECNFVLLNQTECEHGCTGGECQVAPEDEDGDGTGDGAQIGPEGGLVPCGRSEDTTPNNDMDETVSCELCHLFIMFERIVDFVLVYVIPPIAVLMIVIGGVMFFFAGASPEQLSKAKSILTTVVIGLVLIYGAWIITNAFLTMVGVADWTGLTDDPTTPAEEGWFQLNLEDCPGVSTIDPTNTGAVANNNSSIHFF